MMPIYIPSGEHKKMTDRNLFLAKYKNKLDVEWVIVESGSDYYEDEADIYIHEPVRTTPNIAMNKGFEACTGDYVVFFSNDIKVCDNWIELMLKCFDNKDCGIASLGNNEAQDIIDDRIVDGLFFSVCMMKKEDAWFDKNYNRVFDDTDLIFRLYLEGKKFYKNLAGYIEHKVHATLGEYAGSREEFERSKSYFKEKYHQHRNDIWFKRFTGE